MALGDSATVEVDAFPSEPLAGAVAEIANSARIQNAGTAQAVTNFPVVVRLAAAGDNAGAGPGERPKRASAARPAPSCGPA